MLTRIRQNSWSSVERSMRGKKEMRNRAHPLAQPYVWFTSWCFVKVCIFWFQSTRYAKSHNLMQMKAHFNKYVTRLYNLYIMHIVYTFCYVKEALMFSLFLYLYVYVCACLWSAWFELTCSISRHCAFIIRKNLCYFA